MPNSPDVREIFEGGDQKWGFEICERLRVEGIGVPVFYRDVRNKKVEVISDREPGESDESYRVKESIDQQLLGVILPVDQNKSEFVFLSAGRDQGIVFQETQEYWKHQFESDSSPFLMSHNETSFTDFINNIAFGGSGHTKLILKESSDPSRYVEIVEQSISNARRKQLDARQKRGDLRKDIFKRLFGGE